MNISEQTEIFVPKGSIYENEVAEYHNATILDKNTIAHILHRKKIYIDCIVFCKKTRKKPKNPLDREIFGLVFIHNDIFNTYISQIIGLLKELKNRILVLDEDEESRLILRRMINAHKIEATSDIIAKCSVYKEDDNSISLQITAADFTEINIDSKKISALAALSYKELLNFEIEEYGFYVSWPSKDIHLDLDSFKMVSDPKYMNKRIREIEKEKKNFGLLMKKFREEYKKFTQKDFGKLSERQIRKYENGENYPSYDSLEIISNAYNMNINDYLDALADLRKEK